MGGKQGSLKQNTTAKKKGETLGLKKRERGFTLETREPESETGDVKSQKVGGDI